MIGFFFVINDHYTVTPTLSFARHSRDDFGLYETLYWIPEVLRLSVLCCRVTINLSSFCDEDLREEGGGVDVEMKKYIDPSYYDSTE